MASPIRTHPPPPIPRASPIVSWSLSSTSSASSSSDAAAAFASGTVGAARVSAPAAAKALARAPPSCGPALGSPRNVASGRLAATSSEGCDAAAAASAAAAAVRGRGRGCSYLPPLPPMVVAGAPKVGAGAAAARATDSARGSVTAAAVALCGTEHGDLSWAAAATVAGVDEAPGGTVEPEGVSVAAAWVPSLMGARARDKTCSAWVVPVAGPSGCPILSSVAAACATDTAPAAAPITDSAACTPDKSDRSRVEAAAVVGVALTSLAAATAADEDEAAATRSTNFPKTELPRFREEGLMEGGGLREKVVPEASVARGTAPDAVSASTANCAAVVAGTSDWREGAGESWWVKGGWKEDCVRGASEARGTASDAIVASTTGGAADTTRTGSGGEAVEVRWWVEGGAKGDCVRGANEDGGTEADAIAGSTASGAVDRARTTDEAAVDGFGSWVGRAAAAVDAEAELATGGNDQTLAMRRENGVKRWVVEPAETVAVFVTGDRSRARPPSPVPPSVRWNVLSFFVGQGRPA